MKRIVTKNIWFAFMLTVFIVPHVSNLLHFVIFDHNYRDRSNQTEWVNANTVHYCDQFLFKFSPVVEIAFFQWDFFIEKVYSVVPIEREITVKQQASNPIRMRGPPDLFFDSDSPCDLQLKLI